MKIRLMYRSEELEATCRPVVASLGLQIQSSAQYDVVDSLLLHYINFNCEMVKLEYFSVIVNIDFPMRI